MTDTTSILPRAIERGLLNLRSIQESEIEGTPIFNATIKYWVITMRLRIEHGGAFVGEQTRWCVLVAETYPYGSLTFYPAVEGSLTSTFPHQARNIVNSNHPEWLAGKLCLDSPYRTERRLTSTYDPIGDADTRLRWHVERALAWLEAASKNQLLALGDPFELPFRPHTLLKEWRGIRLIHDESPSLLGLWGSHIGKTGIIELGTVIGIENVIGARAFFDKAGAVVHYWQGRPLEKLDDKLIGVWWLWPSPIVLQPWHTPGSWGELRRAGDETGIDVDHVLQEIASSIRGSSKRAILFLGYPIPSHVGSAPTEVHWDGVLLPSLPPGAGKPPDGFRTNATGWWQRDRLEYFAEKTVIEYIETDNWSGDRLQARGRLPPSLRDANIVILGVGALGSCVAEQLVRTGLKMLTIIDPDIVAAGNICRHTLTLEDVGKGKADAVANQLMRLSPLIRVSRIDETLPSDAQKLTEMLEPYDVVLDCTASDEALLLLSNGWWPIPRTFVSFSLGFGANRLFSFGITGHNFPHMQFVTEITPWLNEEASTWADCEEVLEGPGCWSPLFPARYDDVVLAASICIKELVTMTTHRSLQSRFKVFEKRESEEGFLGFSLASRVLPNQGSIVS